MTEMHMRPSRLLAKVRAGEVACMTKMNLADARACEIAAMSGFDCLWTDMEHVPNTWDAVEKQVLAAKTYGADVMVRVARGGYSDYIRPLEMDAAGIMVPHIMSLEDARAVVRMTKFHPLGRRPVDGGNADGAYCAIDFNQYLLEANAQRFLCVQIEDPEPLDELEAIIALEGIDIVFFGPGDFSQGIGAPGQWDHPLIGETRRRIAELCVKHGKFAATVGAPASIEELIDMGYRIVSMGADVVALSQYYLEIGNAFRKAAPSFGKVEIATGGVYSTGK